MTAADLFHRVVNIDDHPRAGVQLHELVRDVLATTAPADSLDVVGETATVDNIEHARAIIIAFAPLGLTSGALLRGGACAALHHTAVGACLSRAYWRACGEGSAVRHYATRYRALAASIGVDLPAVTDARLLRLAIPESSFRGALVGLALARFAHDLLPELIGAALYRALAGSPPLVRAAAQAGDAATDDVAELRALAATFDETRVRVGFGVAATLDREWSSTQAGRTPVRERMLALVRAHASIAAGYHKALPLGESTIDTLLATGELDPERVVDELARSRYVVAGDPDRSALIATAAAGGKMAGVFSTSELATLREWITELGAPNHAVTAAASRAPLASTARAEHHREPAELPVRELYHRLAGSGHHPDVEALAQVFAVRAFEAVSLSALVTPLQRYFRYTPAALDAWCLASHRRQVDQYRPLSGRPALTRAQAIWLLEQVSPMTLVDGCWLQNVPANTEPGALLLRIYYDEIGAGDPAQNHANIHRAALAEVGVELPAVDDRDFAFRREFVGAAFELPTLWLAVAHATRRFFPEALGLNLGMELAGIGGPYMRFADLLRHHGVPATIIELHNTVDNLANGHTALARDAIHAFLDEARVVGGDAHVQELWHRVWRGYRAHEVYFGRFTRACAWRLLPGVIASRFRRAA